MNIYFDTETELFSPGRMAPPMVCLSVCEDDREPFLLHWTDAERYLRPLLTRSDTVFVGAHVAYDVAVCAAQFPLLLPLFFRAYEEDRVTDVLLREKLSDIAAGCFRGYQDPHTGKFITHNYNLEALTRKHTSYTLEKGTYRLTYGSMRHLPISEWPEGATHYALTDARATRDIYVSQEVNRKHLEDEFRQARGAWFLHLGSVWGLRTSKEGVEKLEKETLDAYTALEKVLLSEGLLKKKVIGGKNPRTKITRNTKAAKARMLRACGWEEDGDGVTAGGGTYSYTDALGMCKQLPDVRPFLLTDGGDVSISNEACLNSGDEVLKQYGTFGELKSVLTKDVTALKQGTVFPIHTQYGIAATGRSTSSGPNIQNWRSLPGIREAFVPRPGHLFLQADVGGLELATLAQVCLDLLGESKLAEALNAGLDPHLGMAATILHMPYEDAKTIHKAGKGHEKYAEVNNARQMGKVANFGFPGGLGIPSMIEYAKALYGLILTAAECAVLKDNWITAWPEMAKYFRHINEQMTQADGFGGKVGTIEQVRSKRYRGGIRYTAACNTLFQGLGADTMKHVGFYLARACYTEPSSPLYGGRPVAFVHDENIVEFPDCEGVHEAATELARLTAHHAKVWLPDIPVAAPPLIMRYWSKKAEAVYSESGRLIPWPKIMG